MQTVATLPSASRNGPVLPIPPALPFPPVEPADNGSGMTQTVEALVLDMLEWLSRRERSYTETMDAWRTSCPRLPVWEDASDRGLIVKEHRQGQLMVKISASGLAFLAQRR